MKLRRVNVPTCWCKANQHPECKPIPCLFWKLKIKLFHSKLNFEQREPWFFASQWAALLLCSKALQRNYEQLVYCKLNFDKKEPAFLASQCINLLLHRKPVQRNYLHFFKDFKQKFALFRLIRPRLIVKMLLMEIISWVKITMNIATTKKLCFGYFPDFWPVF